MVDAISFFWLAAFGVLGLMVLLGLREIDINAHQTEHSWVPVRIAKIHADFRELSLAPTQALSRNVYWALDLVAIVYICNLLSQFRMF